MAIAIPTDGECQHKINIDYYNNSTAVMRFKHKLLKLQIFKIAVTN